jgi:hypothetical protein
MLRCEAACKGRASVGADVPFTFDPFAAGPFAAGPFVTGPFVTGPLAATPDLIGTAGAPEPVSGYDVADTGAQMRQDHDI